MDEYREATRSLRIIDANLNRAREALRVMEEYARFVLDDASLSQAVKDARHRLAEVVPAPLHEQLVRSRDIVGDVGRDTKTDAERQRATQSSVAVAACKRVTEALRAIEEYGKTVDAAFAGAIERLRYDAYELERRLMFTISARERFGHVRLYVIITEALCAGDWLETARAVLDGGADCLQLREKNLTDRELRNRSRKLASLCRERGKIFIVNDRPDIAAVAGANGVHLGQDDMTVADARRILPPTSIVGLSTHTVEQFDRAATLAPDYIAVGPMFVTETKPQDHIAGPEIFRAVRSRTSLPLVAIGGIDESNAAEVLAVGNVCLCVCQSVIASRAPSAACKNLRALVDGT